MDDRKLIDDNGFLLHAWQFNKNDPPSRIYPYLVKKKGELEKTFDVSLSGKSTNYRGMLPSEFIRRLLNGSFPEAASVRMKELAKRGSAGNGWLIRNLKIEDTLVNSVHESTSIRESYAAFSKDLERKINEVKGLSSEKLSEIKASYPRTPERIVVETTVFRRNPGVVIEVLRRAGDDCEGCEKSAPFNRRSDGTPYLEVHHVITLAEGGEDTVENAIALCPNCHRQRHHG